MYKSTNKQGALTRIREAWRAGTCAGGTAARSPCAYARPDLRRPMRQRASVALVPAPRQARVGQQRRQEAARGLRQHIWGFEMQDMAKGRGSSTS